MKGDATSNIIDFSKKGNYDTIIMGRRGMGQFKQLVLGSISNKVLNQSDCTVVIVNSISSNMYYIGEGIFHYPYVRSRISRICL